MAERDHQFEAGERLRADYWFAHLPQRVTANWSALAPSERSRRGAPSSAAAFSDNALAAKQRVQHALRDVGPELASVLVDVCCELKGLKNMAGRSAQGRVADRPDQARAALRFDPRGRFAVCRLAAVMALGKRRLSADAWREDGDQ